MRKKLAKRIRFTHKQFDVSAVKVLLATRESNMSKLAKSLKISTAYMHDLLHGKRYANGYITQVAKQLGVAESEITQAPDIEKPTRE